MQMDARYLEFAEMEELVAVKQIKLGAKSWDEACKSTELAALRQSLGSMLHSRFSCTTLKVCNYHHLSPSITISTTIRSLEEGNQDKQAVLLFFFLMSIPTWNMLTISIHLLIPELFFDQPSNSSLVPALRNDTSQ